MVRVYPNGAAKMQHKKAFLGRRDATFPAYSVTDVTDLLGHPIRFTTMKGIARSIPKIIPKIIPEE
jgi:hypothetical protein